MRAVFEMLIVLLIGLAGMTMVFAFGISLGYETADKAPIRAEYESQGLPVCLVLK